jgi:hypothetical protein
LNKPTLEEVKEQIKKIKITEPWVWGNGKV